MKQYPVKNLRDVCLLGHGGEGKTSLTEAMLFLTKATDRFGKVSDGNTVSDYDPEEIKRQISISTTLAPVEWNGCKVNIIDTPGYFDFVGEVMQGVRVADCAVIVATGKSGVQVGTEKSWNYASAAGISKMVFVSKLDEENADFFRTLDQLRERFGVSICPLVIPVVEGEKVKGYLNLLDMTAKSYSGGKPSDMPVTDDMKAAAQAQLEQLSEAVAETDEELMEKYFSGESFTRDELLKGIKVGVLSGSITPVIGGSAYEMAGVAELLDAIVGFAPAPDEVGAISAENDKYEAIEIAVSETDPVSAIVFKTVADPYVGKMSYFKVISGAMKSDTTVVNAQSGANEKIGRLFVIRGKKQIETDTIGTGDIGAVTKLSGTSTGDTLCAPSRKIMLKGVDFPAPTMAMAIMPKAKGDEEKISSGLQRLVEEDPTFRYDLDKETKQQIVSGMGDMHLDIVVSKLKNKFGTSVTLEEPKVAYRETIRKKVRVQGKHKKQSGGHGQFGDVWVEFEPGDTEDLTFEEKVFGGSVPRNFFPAVEKGLRDSIQKGVLAGYPVVNLKATLVDGSYHPVDSSEMSFKIAASLAYKAGLPQASPVLLEPIGHLKVYVPDSYMGDIIGDVNKRRGQILGMNPADGMQEVEAYVPMAEMHSYTIDLRSMTQGRGSYTLEFEKYEEAPQPVAQKVIEDSKRAEDDE